jgi:Rrf2 family protein
MVKSGSSLQLNRAAGYAIRAMIHLAEVPEIGRLMLPELARVTGAPESFLSKILQELCRGGMVTSSRGQSGGFEILPAGRNATIASVIAAVEGPIRLNACLVPEGACDRKEACPAHPVWAGAQTALLKVLDSRTIADLAADTATGARKKSRIDAIRSARFS